MVAKVSHIVGVPTEKQNLVKVDLGNEISLPRGMSAAGARYGQIFFIEDSLRFVALQPSLSHRALNAIEFLEKVRRISVGSGKGFVPVIAPIMVAQHIQMNPNLPIYQKKLNRQKGKIILFPEVLLKDVGGEQHIRSLEHKNGRWGLDSIPLNGFACYPELFRIATCVLAYKDGRILRGAQFVDPLAQG